MAMPAGAVAPVDARLTSTMTLGGVTVVDGGTLDTWGAWTQATPGNRPFYDAIALGNGPCVTNGRLNVTNNPATFVSNAALAIGIPFSLVIVFRADTPKAALCELSADVTAGRGVSFTNSSGWTSQINGPSALQLCDNGNGQLWAADNAVRFIILTCDGTTTKLYVNGTQVFLSQSAVAPGTGSFTVAATIGALHAAGLPLTGAIGAVYPYARVLNAGEIAQVTADVTASWRITPIPQAVEYQLIGVGDSIMLGAALSASTAYNYAHSMMGVLAAQAGARFGTPLNLAVSGAHLPAIQVQWSGTGSASCVSNATNILVAEGGINDVGAGTPVATINADYQALVQAMSARASAVAGGRPQAVVATTLFGTAGTTANALAVSANTRANYLSWGAAGVTMLLADFGNDPVLTAANSNYTQDGTHPTVPGDQRAGTILANVLLAAGF